MKKVLIISICFSVGFVVVMLFLSHREMRAIERFKVKPVTDEIADLSGQSQPFERGEDLLRSKVGRSQENRDVSAPNETRFEMTVPHAIQSAATPKEASEAAFDAGDEEFEVFWKEIEGFAEEYLADLRVRVDEGVAQIEPLFEDMAFYEAQLEPLRRQENWPEFSVAWSGFRQAEVDLYVLYLFLSAAPAREYFGNLYLSSPEYIKLKAFSEDWYARQEKH